jgi:RecA/RadA recombinase
LNLDKLVAYAAKEVQKAHQSGISGRAADLLRRPSGFVSLGAWSLDRICTGGNPGGVPIVPNGRVVHIYGEWSLGKSVILDHMFHSAMQPKALGGHDGIGLCSEVEGTRDDYFLKRIGANMNRLSIQYPKTVEQMIDMGLEFHEQIRKENEEVPIIWGIDSLDAPEAEKSAEKGLTESGGWHYGGGKSEALGAGLRKIVQVTAHYPTTVVLLNQTRVNVGVMFGDKTRTPGGQPPHFYASLELSLRPGGLGLQRGAAPLKMKDTLRKKLGLPEHMQGAAVGRWVRATVTKTKIAPTMQRQGDFYIDFAHGIHPYAGMIPTLIMEGRLTMNDKGGDVVFTSPLTGNPQFEFENGAKFAAWMLGVEGRPHMVTPPEDVSPATAEAEHADES